MKSILEKHLRNCFQNIKLKGYLKFILKNLKLFYRKDLFITSKLSPKNQGIKNCRQSVLDSLEKLQIEYLDLLLIHWPGTSKLRKNDPKNACLRAESWKELEKLQSINFQRNFYLKI